MQSVEIRRLPATSPGGVEIYEGLTGGDALDYLADLQGRQPYRRDELCERLQLPASVLRRKVRDYSRGMRQKIGVVQALQHDPELAILDEPSEGLDPLMQQAFYAILTGLRAEGRTIFFSSTCCRRLSESATGSRSCGPAASWSWPTCPRPPGAAAAAGHRPLAGRAPDLSELPGSEDVRSSAIGSRPPSSARSPRSYAPSRRPASTT